MASMYSLWKSLAFQWMRKWMYNQLKLLALMAHLTMRMNDNARNVNISFMKIRISFSFIYQISPRYVTTGASIKPTAKPSIKNPMKISVTLVAWYNVSQPIKYGILTRIIDTRRPNGSANKWKQMQNFLELRNVCEIICQVTSNWRLPASNADKRLPNGWMRYPMLPEISRKLEF